MSVADITVALMSEAVITYDGAVARWEPDARGRLEQAALELFMKQGYDDTTVADIAAKVGLTERTFFRHFADKREVLFGGSDAMRELLANAIAAAPETAAPIEAVEAALAAVARVLHDRRQIVPRRQSVIAAHQDLRERELIKLASWVDVMAESLRKRGVNERAARLTAEAGMAAFKAAFDRWSVDPERRNLSKLIRTSLDELTALAAGASARRRRTTR
jgi:AcrR family transcriptional regulator